MQEVCVWSHELVREAVLHAHLLVGLVEVLLRPLLLHIGCMLLLLLLKIVLIEGCTSDHTIVIRRTCERGICMNFSIQNSKFAIRFNCTNSI